MSSDFAEAYANALRNVRALRQRREAEAEAEAAEEADNAKRLSEGLRRSAEAADAAVLRRQPCEALVTHGWCRNDPNNPDREGRPPTLPCPYNHSVEALLAVFPDVPGLLRAADRLERIAAERSSDSTAATNSAPPGRGREDRLDTDIMMGQSSAARSRGGGGGGEHGHANRAEKCPSPLTEEAGSNEQRARSKTAAGSGVVDERDAVDVFGHRRAFCTLPVPPLPHDSWGPSGATRRADFVAAMSRLVFPPISSSAAAAEGCRPMASTEIEEIVRGPISAALPTQALSSSRDSDGAAALTSKGSRQSFLSSLHAAEVYHSELRARGRQVQACFRHFGAFLPPFSPSAVHGGGGGCPDGVACLLEHDRYALRGTDCHAYLCGQCPLEGVGNEERDEASLCPMLHDPSRRANVPCHAYFRGRCPFALGADEGTGEEEEACHAAEGRGRRAKAPRCVRSHRCHAPLLSSAIATDTVTGGVANIATSSEVIEGDVCVLCLGRCAPLSSGVADLPCGHSFHDCCVADWLLAHRACPLCREPVERL